MVVPPKRHKASLVPYASPATVSSAVPRTLDDLINSVSVWQRSLAPVLCRSIPTVFAILGMTFLAPKSQTYSCAPMYQMNDDAWREWNRGVDLRCSYRPLDSEATSSHNGVERCSAWTFDTADFTRTIKQEFNWVCGNEWMQAFSESSFMVGMMAGSLLFSHVSDWYGRKWSITASGVLALIAAIGASLSPNFSTFGLCRIALAIGVGGCQSGPMTLAMETMNAKHRSVVSFCDVLSWTIGIMLLPVFPYFIRDWRWLQFVLSFGALPLIVSILLVDESPKWLLATGQKDRARPVIRRMLRRNGFADGDREVEEMIYVSSSEVTKQCEAQARERSSVLSLFGGRSTAITTLAFLVQFPLYGMVYYNMMFFVVDVGNDPYLNTLLAGVFEIPSPFLIFTMVRFFRRKVVYYILNISSALAIFALCFTFDDQTSMRRTFGAIAKVGCQVLFSVLTVHANELYPTRMRSIALGLFLTVASVGAMASPLVKGIKDMSFITALNTSCCLIGLLVSLPLRETFNRSLPDDDISDQDEDGATVADKTLPINLSIHVVDKIELASVETSKF